jgi:pantoate--beta-alanine ligase
VRIVHDPLEFRAACALLRKQGRVGFVPTMGALHDGHLQLMRHARTLAPHVAVSIFVNPTQFGPSEDLAQYPRDLQSDSAACERAGVDLLFAPSPEAMYPAGDALRIEPGPIAAGLCGAYRPGHFAGVCTVLGKFWSLSGACTSVFGRKDYQQWKVLQRLARELFFDVEVVGHPIVREADGLAMSSRNRYLGLVERTAALGIVRALREAQSQFAAGERSGEALLQRCEATLGQTGLRLQYAELADPDDLSSLARGALGERALLAVAAFSGKTRLIDNCVLGEDAPL